jgi:uncharacterized protein
MPRVIHFEITTDDPERAVKFYEEVFGWKTQRWGGGNQTYWLMDTGSEGPGIGGGIMRRQPGFPPTLNTIGVPSVDEFAKKVVVSGGSVVMEKRPIPGVGYQAYCKDTEGNVFGIHQSDPSAK